MFSSFCFFIPAFFMADLKYLFVGLGNPGQEYFFTRHNIGFYFLDIFAQSNGWQIDAQKFKGVFSSGRLHGVQVFCVKPQNFMNRSGECVRSFLEYFKIPLERLLVLHDDLDLAVGRIKVVRNGGAGGHNGIRSIIQHLGCQGFARVKVGIGRPSPKENGQLQPVDQFVLSRMTADELEIFSQRRGLIEEALSLFVKEGIDVCMNKINGR